MLWEPHLIAEIELLTTEDGGRRTAITAESYGCPVGFEGEFFESRLDLSEVGPIAPGGRVRVPVRFFHPELIVPRLTTGSSFTLWEGKTIGRGTVISFHNAESAV